MKIYATSDTHFGHDKLQALSGRPADFGELILEDLKKHHGDILIHCGDFCIGDDKPHTESFMEASKGFDRKVLVRGNHDCKSDLWYYTHGWDFVCRSMELKIFGKRVLFTHPPIRKSLLDGLQLSFESIDMNIHGHLHGNANRHAAKDLYDHDFHYDLAPETHDYKIVNLEKLLQNKKK